MNQGSNNFEEENDEMMNIEEVARSIEYLRALGLTEKQINDYHKYIATGIGLPIKDEETEEK